MGHPPDKRTLNSAFQSPSEKLQGVEYLIGYEGGAFASTGDVAADLSSITAVHLRWEDAVTTLLRESGVLWATMRRLVQQGLLPKAEYRGYRYYTRRWGQGDADG
jgi:hypothetical protein